jgi:hypothetical protein
MVIFYLNWLVLWMIHSKNKMNQITLFPVKIKKEKLGRVQILLYPKYLKTFLVFR